ncbi:hypothetical protein CYMTET_41905 [Cymbomonas tetramitiformis]|uniref:AAA+ ATPase domain-containing protein n=1 Tax=Cymbomonas tetramitiformis TaxID=36881 RepID=A0AAE0C567_9CHLO|nr:hypothetical protein CYMTET_41905 [Cymbomonas tetramitiformis]
MAIGEGTEHGLRSLHSPASHRGTWRRPPCSSASAREGRQEQHRDAARPANARNIGEVGDPTGAPPQAPAEAQSNADEQRGDHSQLEQVELAKKSLRTLLDKDAALPQTLSLGQPEEVAQLLAMLHVALDQEVILDEGQVTQLLGTLFSAAKACTGDAALLARLVCLQRCVHRLLLVTKKLEDVSDLSEEKAQWKQAADKLRRLCVSRFRSPTQSHGGTALLELHLSQVQLTLVHLPAHKLSEQMASAAFNVGVGAVAAAVVGSYGTLVKGIGQAVGAGLDAMSQRLSRECFVQLKDLSQRPRQDADLKCWLRKVHDEHFELGKDGRWEPKGRGRWEPKAAFAAMLADVAAAEPSRLSPELLQMVCLGEEDFIGLTNLMALGADSAAGVEGAQAGLVNLTVWAQEVLLHSLEEDTTHQNAVPPEQEAAAEAASATNLQESRLPDPSAAAPGEQPASSDESWGDEHGLQVVADELERFTIEGMAKLAGAAELMTAAAAKGLSKHVEDALLGGERGSVKRAKPQAVAALAACDEVLGIVEETLHGVQAAADASLPLAQLASKLLRAFLTRSEAASLVAGAMHRALCELDAWPRHLEARLTAVLSEEGFAQRLQNVVAELLGQSSAGESTSSRQAARPGTSERAGPMEETAKDLVVGLLCDAVLPELDPLREDLALLMELQGTVACTTRSKVERCMEESTAMLEQEKVGMLVERLQKSIPAEVRSRVSDRIAEMPGFKKLSGVDAPSMAAWVGERQEAPPPSGEMASRLHDVIVRVDAGVATLKQVSTCTDTCARVLKERVRPPLSEAHARLSGKPPDRADSWYPSFIPGRQKGKNARDDGAAAAAAAAQGADLAQDPARVWQRLSQALGGLDRILCHITQTEIASGWSPEEHEDMSEDTVSLALQAGPPHELPAVAPGSKPLSRRATQRWEHWGTAQRFVARAQANPGVQASAEVTDAFSELSLLLTQTQALVGSLPRASRGLHLRALDAAKEGLTATVHNVIKEMTVVAREQLESLAEGCTDSLGDAATSALGDTCGALVAPALGLLGEAARGRKSRRASEFWQVREVAVVSGLRVLDALRHEAAGATRRTAPAEKLASFRAVRKELQSAVLVRFSLERAPSLKALQRNGEALAAELNASLRVVPAPGDARTASVTRATADSGALEELLKALAQERERSAAREQEEERKKLAAAEQEERKKLAAAEQHAAWVEAQALIKKTMEAQLRDLEEAQKAVEREPNLLKKQLLLVRCRDLHRGLAQSSRNVEDIGTAVGVMAGFLTTVNDKLDVVNESLNALQSSVRELGADLKRMVGRPVLEELVEQRERRLAQCQELRREVYIATDGVGPGDDGKFLATDSNKPKDLLEDVKKELLESEKVSLLLLSGPAGSGKSTFVRHLEVYLEMEYMEQTRGENVEVVLVKVSLPTLKNPMADLFHEALARGYGLREAQIHELRDLARAGQVRLIFLLDAYDELPNQCLFKNLYMSNNLEQYRNQSEEGSAPPAYPKVIITTRTELLSRDLEYARAFVPMEMDKPARATVEDARAAFLELRIAPFDSKVDRYIHAKVALEVRGELERHVGALAALSKEAASELMKKAAGVLLSPDSAEASSDTEDMLEAACAAVTAPGVGKEEPLERVRRYMAQVPVVPPVQPLFHVVWVLAGVLAEASSGLKQTLEDFCDGMARADTGKIWLHRDYRDAFDTIPELKELTTTPFMVEIVTEILPKLQELQSTDASMKAKLLLLLNEDAAQMVWGCISRWRGAEDFILKQAQAGLEDKPSQAPAPEAGSGITELAKEVGEVLKGQDLILKQGKLAEIGLEQLQAMGRVSAQGTTKGQAGGVDAGIADGALTDSLAVLGCDAEVDGLLREMVGEVVTEEESRLLEGAIFQTGILYLLKSALQRPRVRRNQIYGMFVAMYMRREASKSLTRGTYEAGTVEREGAQYAQRLALTMVAENMTKVPLGSGSELFHAKSVWDPFLRDGGELRAAAQKAAPVRCEGGVLTFIHKTVQEYLCAASLRASLHQILRNLAAPLEDLEGVLQPEGELNDGDESARRQAGAVAGTDGSKDGDAPELHGEGSPHAAVQQTEQAQRRRARAARALGRAEERLLQSEWAQVDLRDEDVVRDFLVDSFLDDMEFVAEVCFVVAWAERRCAGGCKAGGGGLACDLLLGNVRALLGGALPKRSGGTLLHAAAADGFHFAVSKLLGMRRRGIMDSALLEGRDDKNRTPLFCAAQSGHAQVTAALLAAGARRDARSKLRPEVEALRMLPGAWFVAAERGMVEMVRVLVGEGAEVDAEDVEGRTALTVALAFGQEAAARALLEVGAGVNAGTGWRPLHAASERGTVEMVRELAGKGAEVDAEDADSRTALTVALAFGQEAAAWALLEVGAGVNAGTGRRPLHAAAERGMVEVVRELAGKGAEVDAEDGEGRTSLTLALAGAHESVVAALLEAGAGVNAGTGQRPVYAAAERGIVEILRELVDKGAEVDAEDGAGRTALTVALAFGQEAAARALLEAGAGVNAGTGRRPVHAAAEKGMVEMLADGGQKVELVGSARASAETVRLMKEARADFGGAVQWAEARGQCFSAEILQLVQK